MNQNILISGLVSFFVSVVTIVGLYNFMGRELMPTEIVVEEELAEKAPALSLLEKVDTEVEQPIDVPVTATPANEDELVLEIQAEASGEAEIPEEDIDEGAFAVVEVELPPAGEIAGGPEIEPLEEENLTTPADEEVLLLDEFDESVTPTTAPFEEVLIESSPEAELALPVLEEPESN